MGLGPAGLELQGRPEFGLGLGRSPACKARPRFVRVSASRAGGGCGAELGDRLRSFPWCASATPRLVWASASSGRRRMAVRNAAAASASSPGVPGRGRGRCAMGVVGPEADGGAELGDRPVVIVLDIAQDRAEVDVGFHGSGRSRMAVRKASAARHPPDLQGDAEIVVRLASSGTRRMAVRYAAIASANSPELQAAPRLK